MNRVNLTIVFSTALIILGVINYSVWQKERHLANGEIIYLELAPADPRSIMQGDYMTLEFKISRQIQRTILAETAESIDQQGQEGFVIVNIDDDNRAEFSSIDDGMQTLSSKQRKLQYRIRAGRVKFASNAFFFEEGDASMFTNAKYAELKVNKHGEILLTGLLDENLKKLGE